ncbi:MAG: hypothetical protein MI867_05600, partial [Pseudomonadales bacterium]|nr:hypothetical protein [Pseudomonadales bacterium]
MPAHPSDNTQRMRKGRRHCPHTQATSPKECARGGATTRTPKRQHQKNADGAAPVPTHPSDTTKRMRTGR